MILYIVYQSHIEPIDFQFVANYHIHHGFYHLNWMDQNNHLKQRTILLRRTPDGQVTTLAGGAYGHRDGTETEAQFSSVGGLAFGADGSLYLSDGV